jgi:hypothetical protein
MCDFEGRVIRRVLERCRELGIDTTQQMFDCTDPALREAIAVYRQWSHDPMDPSDAGVLPDLKFQAEHLTAADVFPRFDEIVFDDERSFAALADRFLDDDAGRADIARRMHQAVLEHFAYDSQMRRFLQFHAHYLESVASSGANS